MAKQSIFGRMAQLTHIVIEPLLSAADDPGAVLDQMVRDITESIAEAEATVAHTVGRLRLLEQDHAEDVANTEDWGRKARALSEFADQLRADGAGASADRFDDFARLALHRQFHTASEARRSEPTIASQTALVDELNRGVTIMRAKLGELSTKRDQLISQARRAQGDTPAVDALGSIDIYDPTLDITRFEEKVQREKRRLTEGPALDASSLDLQFDTEAPAHDKQVEHRLAQIKRGEVIDDLAGPEAVR